MPRHKHSVHPLSRRELCRQLVNAVPDEVKLDLGKYLKGLRTSKRRREFQAEKKRLERAKAVEKKEKKKRALLQNRAAKK